jgi:formylmethanofuran dehydrogenase subunit D
LGLEVTLLTGRTIDQGCGKEAGKLSEEYMENVAVCEMNTEDMKKLGIKDNSNVKVTTEFGSVVLKAKKSKRIKTSSMAFIPCGLWANQILTSNTDGTGMPLLKGVKATIESSDSKVPSIRELLFNIQTKVK